MRVIAGTAGGRRLQAPPGLAVRPTGDRVKEALFSSIQVLLRDAVVLDLYAGSGALGIEALSRGAARATFVEQAPAHADVIRKNLATVKLEAQADVIPDQVLSFLGRPSLHPAQPVTLAFLDPPYDLDEQALATVLAALVSHLASDGATVVVERAATSPGPSWPDALRPLRDRAYGSTHLHLAQTTGH